MRHFFRAGVKKVASAIPADVEPGFEPGGKSATNGRDLARLEHHRYSEGSFNQTLQHGALTESQTSQMPTPCLREAMASGRFGINSWATKPLKPVSRIAC